MFFFPEDKGSDELVSPEKKKEEEVTENPHDLRYDRLKLPKERREEIGRKTKGLLDYARLKYVEDKLGLNAKLFYYCTPEISLENVLLIAK